MATDLYRDNLNGAVGNFVGRSPDVGGAYANVGGGSLADVLLDGSGSVAFYASFAAPASALSAAPSTSHTTEVVFASNPVVTSAHDVRVAAFDDINGNEVVTLQVKNTGSSFSVRGQLRDSTNHIVYSTGFQFSTPTGTTQTLKGIVTPSGVDFQLDGVSIGSSAAVTDATPTSVQWSGNGPGIVAQGRFESLRFTNDVSAPPDPPTDVIAYAGDASATVVFTPSSGTYTVISSPAGGTDSNAGSSATTHAITGLTNGTPYTFTVVANNGADSAPSDPSNSITPHVAVVGHNLLTKTIIAGVPAVETVPGTPDSPGVPAYCTNNHVTRWASFREQFTLGIIPALPLVPLGEDASIGGWLDHHGGVVSFIETVCYPEVLPTIGTPSIPGTPAVPADYQVGWNAGARSIDSIRSGNAGQYRFSVPGDVVGVITGLNDADIALDPGYTNIDYALEFAAGAFRVVEDAVAHTGFVPYSASDVFTIARDRTWVRYFHNDAQVYVSATRSSAAVFADASLYYGGDAISDASISESVSATFTGDVIEGAQFTEWVLADESTLTSAAFSEHFSDNHDVVGTTGGLRDTHAVETGAFVESFLLDESVLESGAFAATLLLEPSIRVVDHASASTTLDDDDGAHVRGRFTEHFSDNHDVVGTTGGVRDTHAVETGGFVESLLDVPGVQALLTSPISVFADTLAMSVTSLRVEYGAFTETIVEHASANVVEGGAFTEAVVSSSVFNNTLADAGVFADALLSQVPTNLVVTGALTDVQTRAVSSVFADTGAFTLTSAFAATLVNNAVEHVAGTDTPLLIVTDTVVESGTGTHTQATAVASVTAEAGTGTDVALQTMSAVNLVSDVGNIVDVPQVGFASNNVEGGAATETILPLRVALDLTVEGGQLTDASSLINRATTQIVDAGTFTNTQTSLLVGTNTFIEYGFFDDILQGGGATGAWTAHLETFAMSRYSNYPFQSMAVVDGVLIGVNEDAGVFRLDAENDAGDVVDASVIHDWDDAVLNDRGEMQTNEYPKHPRFMYMGALLSGDMAFTLGYVGRNGNEAFAQYNYPAKTTSAFATGRAILGRGISSRYLRPGFANVAGARFAINDATIVVDTTVRR